MAFSSFPQGKFKCIGGFQVAAGLITFITAVIFAVLNIVYHDELVWEPQVQSFDFNQDIHLFFYWFSVGYVAICGCMHIITGSIGVAAGRTEKGHKQAGLKTGYITLNVINTLFFTLGLIICGIAAIVLIVADFGTNREKWLDERAGMVTLWTLVTLVGLFTFVADIVAASISCCCAPVVEKSYSYEVGTSSIRKDQQSQKQQKPQQQLSRKKSSQKQEEQELKSMQNPQYVLRQQQQQKQELMNHEDWSAMTTAYNPYQSNYYK